MKYHTFEELKSSIFEYIEGYYNPKRPHGALGYLMPDEAEAVYDSKKSSATA